MQLMPPIIVNNKLGSYYKEKANHFNKLFTSQCTPIDNDPQIPDSVVLKTETRLSSITCEDNDILKLSEILTLARSMVLMIF